RRKPCQQLAADSQPPRLGTHEQVLEVDSRPSQKSREVVEEQREPHGLAPGTCEHDFGVRTPPEQRLAQPGFGSDDFVLQMLILRQIANELQNDPHLVRAGGANGNTLARAPLAHFNPLSSLTQPVLCRPCAMPLMLASSASNRSRSCRPSAR